jgi:hypothetical protein
MERKVMKFIIQAGSLMGLLAQVLVLNCVNDRVVDKVKYAD